MLDQILAFIPAHEAQLLTLFGSCTMFLSLLFGFFKRTIWLSKALGSVSPADLIRIWKYVRMGIEWFARWRAARKIVNGLLFVGLLLAVSGCSLEAARTKRVHSQLAAKTFGLPMQTRPAVQCKAIDDWHLGLEIAGGVVVAPIGVAAVAVAAADTSKQVETIALGTAIGVTAIEAAILLADGKLVAIYTEECQ